VLIFKQQQHQQQQQRHKRGALEAKLISRGRSAGASLPPLQQQQQQQKGPKRRKLLNGASAAAGNDSSTAHRGAVGRGRAAAAAGGSKGLKGTAGAQQQGNSKLHDQQQGRKLQQQQRGRKRTNALRAVEVHDLLTDSGSETDDDISGSDVDLSDDQAAMGRNRGNQAQQQQQRKRSLQQQQQQQSPKDHKCHSYKACRMPACCCCCCCDHHQKHQVPRGLPHKHNPSQQQQQQGVSAAHMQQRSRHISVPPLRLPHEQQQLLQPDLLQHPDMMLLDVCEDLGFAVDDPWRQQQQQQQQHSLLRQRQASHTSGVARTGSSGAQQQQQQQQDGGVCSDGDGEQSLVDVAVAAGEAVRQDSLLHPVGSGHLQVLGGYMVGLWLDAPYSLSQYRRGVTPIQQPG
jgi:hypothetical protein